MSEPRDQRGMGVPSGDLGTRDGSPDLGMSLDDGRVEFAPRDSEALGTETGLGLRNVYPDDAEIQAQVSNLMTGEGWVDASAIQVHVADGEVTLDGSVDTPEDARLAENIARAVANVRAVHNHLRVRGPGRA